MNAHANGRGAVEDTSLTPEERDHLVHVTRVFRLDTDRAVADIDVGPLHIGSFWVVGIADGRPVPSWPRTARGFPIVSCDPPLRDQIERAVLEAVAAA